MLQFSGSISLEFPLAEVAVRLSNAAFLARCVPNAEVVSATIEEATWRVPSPFRFVSGTVTTNLRLVPQTAERTDFALANRVPGGSVQVEGHFRFTPTDSGTTIDWSAAVVARTGIVKIVPESVISAQVEASLLEIWQGVRENWNRWER